MGVDMFFVISGFLISALLVEEIETNRNIDFLQFYARRLRRLVPALVAMLLVCTGLTYFLLSPLDQEQHLTAAATAALWVSNFHFAFEGIEYFGDNAAENLFVHTWSLGVEEQFYILWPFLIAITYFGIRRFGLAGRIEPIAVVSSIALFASLLWILQSESNQQDYFLPFSRAWQFSVGAFALLVSRSLGESQKNLSLVTPPRSGPFSSFLSYAGLATLAFGILFYSENKPYPGWWAILPTLGTAFLLVGGNASNGISKLLSTRPAIFFGNISYGWYLWHWPMLVFLNTFDTSGSLSNKLLAVLGSIVLAVLSLHLIENPIRYGKFFRLPPKPTILFSAATLAVTALIPMGLVESNYNNLLTNDELNKLFLAKKDMPPIYTRGCDDWIESSEAKQCRNTHVSGNLKVHLIGDSTGAQWYSALAAIPGWNLTILTKAACPILNESYFYKPSGDNYKVCDEWKKNVIKEIEAAKPDVVIMATSYKYPFSDKQWFGGTTKYLDSIVGNTNQVIIIESTPRLSKSQANCTANKLWQKQSMGLNLPFQCVSTMKNARLNSVNLILSQVADSYPKVDTVNFNDLICPKKKCNNFIDGILVFRDQTHVTDSFVRYKQKAIAERLGRILHDR